MNVFEEFYKELEQSEGHLLLTKKQGVAGCRAEGNLHPLVAAIALSTALASMLDRATKEMAEEDDDPKIRELLIGLSLVSPDPYIREYMNNMPDPPEDIANMAREVFS